MSFLSALQLLFIALKLLGVVAWSWWAVFTPFYITIVLYVVLLVGLGTFDSTHSRKRPF